MRSAAETDRHVEISRGWPVAPRAAVTSGLWPLLAVVVCLVLAVGTLLDRTWRFGEVFSPADAIFAFYPWAYDAPNTTPSNLTRTDEAFFHQPLVETHWPRLRSGDWPDLDPLVLAGVPGFFQGLAAGQAFSPLSLPFYFASPALAVTLYAPLRLVCAGIFMFLFLRACGSSLSGAVAGALAFALNGAFITWLSAPIPTVALWLPLAWLSVDRMFDRQQLADAAVLALVLACLWLGAYPPTSLACGFAIAAYAGARLLETGAWRSLWLAAAAVVGSLLLASVGLGPMLVTLLDSPVAGRTMGASHATLDVLVTFALPDFFGNPAQHSWWRPGNVSYPELVSYVGVVTLILAGCGLRARLPHSGWRQWFFAALAATALGVMYGWMPFSWISALPGFRQTNVMRWNVVFAASVAVLAAYGVDWLAARSHQKQGPVLGALTCAGFLSAIVVIAFVAFRPTLRALNLQPLEWRQLSRFGALAGGAVVFVLLRSAIAVGSPTGRAFSTVAGWIAVGLIGLDLVSFGRGFNPTIAPERFYPSTPAIEFLQREVGNTRIAMAGPDSLLLQGHVFSVFGLPMVTGFDYKGDAEYQRLMARADGRQLVRAEWNHVLLTSPDRLNLRLLGLLGAELIATPPVDSAPVTGAYAALPDLVDGRVIRQQFTARQDNLRRIDVLMATHGRLNEGTLVVRLVADDGPVVAERAVDAAMVKDNDWLTLDFEPLNGSSGRRFWIELAGHKALPGAAVTAWAVQVVADPNAPLRIDTQPTPQVLVYRAFSANDRLDDAPLVYARDLNVYRNPHAQPRAWFVQATEHLPASAQLDRLADAAFDAGHLGLIDRPLDAVATTNARVQSIAIPEPDRREILVDAPEGGVLMIGDRAEAGWAAFVDGRPAAVSRADAVLMAVAVPPGAKRVVLTFHQRPIRAAAVVSLVTFVMALALAVTRQSRPSVRPSLQRMSPK